VLQPTDLERSVMALLLRGEHPALEVLRRQWQEARSTRRETSGVGSFLTLDVPASVPALVADRRITLGDVVVDLPACPEAIGAVLFVEGGALSMLELFTFDRPWPDDTSGFSVRYIREPRTLSQLDDEPSIPSRSPTAPK
jgi:hypothetical protein